MDADVRVVAGPPGSGTSAVADPLLARLRTDPATLRHRPEHRGSPRDTGKITGFDAFVARMRPEEPLPVDHLEIDNRLAAPPIDGRLSARCGR